MADRAAQGTPSPWETLARAPRFPLAHLPTPLEQARGLEAVVPGVRLFIKRDDCTGLAFGGNKSRKLEYSIGRALAERATALVTASSLQSNHVRQTAAAAARAGLPFHAVVAPALDHFPASHIDSGNLALSAILGAYLHLAADDDSLEESAAAVVRELEANGERPFLIPLGASDGTGSLGYVACALELLDQCASRDISPSAVFTATGSCGTQAGLLAGLRLSGSHIPVVGISVSEPAAVKREKVRACLDSLSETLDRSIACADEEIIVYDDYTGGGYAHPTDEADQWVRALARSDGLLLDPVYTGKAFAGMADLLRSGRIAARGDVVFLHTGGAPALFADPSRLWRPERDEPAIASLYARTGPEAK